MRSFFLVVASVSLCLAVPDAAEANDAKIMEVESALKAFDQSHRPKESRLPFGTKTSFKLQPHEINSWSATNFNSGQPKNVRLAPVKSNVRPPMKEVTPAQLIQQNLLPGVEMMFPGFAEKVKSLGGVVAVGEAQFSYVVSQLKALGIVGAEIDPSLFPKLAAQVQARDGISPIDSSLYPDLSAKVKSAGGIAYVKLVTDATTQTKIEELVKFQKVRDEQLQKNHNLPHFVENTFKASVPPKADGPQFEEVATVPSGVQYDRKFAEQIGLKPTKVPQFNNVEFSEAHAKSEVIFPTHQEHDALLPSIDDLKVLGMDTPDELAKPHPQAGS